MNSIIANEQLVACLKSNSQLFGNIIVLVLIDCKLQTKDADPLGGVNPVVFPWLLIGFMLQVLGCSFLACSLQEGITAYGHTSHPSNLTFHKFVVDSSQTTTIFWCVTLNSTVKSTVKSNLQITYYFTALCWMNERHARMQ